MSIEIRQMVVKSNVRQDAEEKAGEAMAEQNYDEMKKSITEACRKMVAEMLQEKRER